jgi:hypothetical protein
MATADLLKSFMKAKNIDGRPDLITPDHARELLKAIATSNDPRIQSYRQFIGRFRPLYFLRSEARGNE